MTGGAGIAGCAGCAGADIAIPDDDICIGGAGIGCGITGCTGCITGGGGMGGAIGGIATGCATGGGGTGTGAGILCCVLHDGHNPFGLRIASHFEHLNMVCSS